MKQLVTTLIFFISFSFTGLSQKSTVNWVGAEQADELSKENPKKMMIFIYTDWCGYCKMMEKQIFRDEKIASYINENYYPVKFNAEQKQPVAFDGYTYEYVNQQPRGAHQFAIDLLQGRLAYPGLVFLEEDKDLINRFTGVQPKELLEKYLVFVSEDHYLEKDWFEYSNQQQN